MLGGRAALSFSFPRLQQQGCDAYIRSGRLGVASRFGLEGYSNALRNEVSPFGIDVIMIDPGGIETEWDVIAKEKAERYSAKSTMPD